ncbi:MAG TPA: phosphoribosyltransferase family protein [Patescibacteria group bacterium]|nr:phosphoribosyltransferase family protein [Patescibacteria group bacterium]
MPRMTRDEVKELLISLGAVLTGHFELQSGLHSLGYLAKSYVTPDPKAVEDLCYEIALQYLGRGVEAVVSPVVGAVVLGYEISRVLTRMEGRKVFNYYAEKVPGKQDLYFGRGYYEALSGFKTLLVDDIVTTGGSLKRLKAALPNNATVIGAGLLANRGDVTAEAVDIPELYALATFEIPNYEPGPQACPGCREGIPLDLTFGHAGVTN